MRVSWWERRRAEEMAVGDWEGELKSDDHVETVAISTVLDGNDEAGMAVSPATPLPGHRQVVW